MNAWGWATAAVLLCTMFLMIYIDLRDAKRECEEAKSYVPYWISATFWIAVLSS